MTRAEIQTGLQRELARIAPEVDPAALDPDTDLREELDLDSMDFLNFVGAIDRAFRVSVPEADYPRVATLRGCVDYIAQHLHAL